MSKGSELASNIKYFLDYSKWNNELNRAETWDDSVDRVMEMHRKKFQKHFQNPRFTELFEQATQAYKDKLVLGSQRSLQFGGEPMMKHQMRMFNCLSSYCDRIEFFQETMYLLLCGCGVGFSVQYKHNNKLPNIVKRTKGTKTFIVPDSIEGWADAVGILMSSYSESNASFPEYQGYEIRFDFSLIRPRGSEITGGFKAPGPEALRNSLIKIESLLEKSLIKGNRIDPIISYDIVMHIADAVLSGGVRRSATICLFSLEDKEMMVAKATPNWHKNEPQRARSNNSVVLNRNNITKEQFDDIFESIKMWGEPGFYFTEDEDVTTNPCFHKDTWLRTDKGTENIYDLYLKGKELNVLTDNRTGKGDILDLNKKGVSLKPSTKIHLTQKSAKIFQITTEHGYKLKATENHEFPTTQGRKKLKDLKKGDKLLIQNDEGEFGNEGSFDLGLITGIIVGDGSFYNDTAYINIWEDDFDISNDLESRIKGIINNKKEKMGSWTDFKPKHSPISKKTIQSKKIYKAISEFNNLEDLSLLKYNVPKNIFKGSRETIVGYLQGIFFADSNITLAGNPNNRTLSLQLTQSKKSLLEDIQNLLLNFGIVSRIYKVKDEGFQILPDGKGGKKEFYCNSVYRLDINRPNLIKFIDNIGIYGRKKDIAFNLLNIRGYNCNKPERYITKIKSIDFDCIDDVYCLHQPETNIVIANGIVTGQCVEISFYPQTKDGISGWQGCNLTEGNGGKAKTKEIFFHQCAMLSFLGTLQASYTDFKYVGKATKEIFEGESLLGCSFTGWMSNTKIMLDEEIQREGARIVKAINKEVAEIIGINQAARTTCSKPSGNASVILETTSGTGGAHSKRFFRLMQANKENEITQYFKENFPNMVEESVYSRDNTDYTIYVPIEIEGNNVLYKKDLYGINQLEIVKSIQKNWVEEGTNIELCRKPYIRHNVSNTIDVENWDEVRDYVYDNKDYFTGVSFLSIFGDKDFEQAPFTSVLTASEIFEKYGENSMFASGLIVDGLHAFDQNLHQACNHLLNNNLKLEGTRVQVLIKKDWLRRVKQFSKRYLKGDINKTIYLLKDLDFYHKWIEINRELKPINWFDLAKTLKPQYTNIDTMGAAACSGGQCEMPDNYFQK